MRSVHPFYLVFSVPTEEFDLCPEDNRLISETQICRAPSSGSSRVLQMQVLGPHFIPTESESLMMGSQKLHHP